MKKFALLTIGFETPTPEIMSAWKAWFDSLKDNIIHQVGLRSGLEVSAAGTKDLPLGLDSVTGVMIISAASLDDAERMAQTNPFISSIRVYEVMER
ncbi:hypothetical protein [Ciceribacter ferrooxidans]|uniref:YCII-related domain-containing protein n=1 Tax=Ciceribacter ferrooxidans TaxID=2509717 RepID=A0A4Q2T5D7_9HYPH|nr:hypothetical protein [Ciceribacter ferrooxidans]RYC14006.1 hypothetical protein EUU22_10820 [Ciceribacter ferrooxidans]